jgi:hypothetical protein
MRRLLALSAFLLAGAAHADCVCRCVDGQVRALCSSTLDLQPICAPQLCPIVPPALAPLPSLQLPPLGTTSCRQVQVLNPLTQRYEFRRVCS